MTGRHSRMAQSRCLRSGRSRSSASALGHSIRGMLASIRSAAALMAGRAAGLRFRAPFISGLAKILATSSRGRQACR